MDHYVFEKSLLVDSYGQVNNGKQVFQIEQLHKALPGDIVDYDANTKTLLRIIKRCADFIPGILLCNGPVMGIIKKGPTSSILKRKFIPDDKSFPTFIVTCRKKSGPNEYGIIQFKEWESEYPLGTFINKIGNGIPGDLETEKMFHKYSHGVMRKKYSKKLDMTPYNIDITPERKNINACIVSIDPEGCYDIDDALHIKKLSDDIYEIGIHIADVSSFIPIDSELDHEASKRCESLYLNWEQDDMFPNEIVKKASLFENIPRRSFSTIIKIKKDGTIIETHFTKSIINVTKNLSYQKAQELVNKNKPEKITDTIKELFELGKNLYDSKTIISSDEEYDIHTTVSVFMVLCNSLVANEIYRGGIYEPICRSHEGFSEIDIDISDNDIKNKIIQYSTSAAIYVLGKSPHKALGQSLYSHFSSPLRRYVDILSHRMLYNTIKELTNKVSYRNLIEDLYIVNKMHSCIQKANRRSILLQKAYNMYEKNDTVTDTFGYIIGIDDTRILIHVPDYSIDIYAQIYSYRIKHLLAITNSINEITINHVNNGSSLTLKLGQKVDFKIIITFREEKFTRKIFGQLTNPNPMNMFKFSLFDDDI